MKAQIGVKLENVEFESGSLRTRANPVQQANLSVLTEKIEKIGSRRASRQFVHDPSNAPTPSFLQEALDGLKDKQTPELTSEGTAATYILRNSDHDPVAVFKPADEEAFAPCNPRGYMGIMGQAGFRQGVCSGEQVEREVAAYALDNSSFSRVP
jgi:hypothetical protein